MFDFEDSVNVSVCVKQRSHGVTEAPVRLNKQRSAGGEASRVTAHPARGAAHRLRHHARADHREGRRAPDPLRRDGSEKRETPGHFPQRGEGRDERRVQTNKRQEVTRVYL